MGQKQSILVVEDELAIRTGLIDVLVYHGYQVDFAEDGKQGLDKALNGQFDLIILDVMLPSMNGYDICREIRQHNKAQPIIMLTAKSSDEDIILGLTLGADDYVAKPFSITQLLLRIEAVLRRSGKVKQITPAGLVIQLDSQRHLDLQNLSVEINNGSGAQTVSFTKREMQVIEYLYHNATRPVSREELLEQVWGYDPQLAIETRTVDIHIAKIRRKIEPDSKTPQFLITVRGAGYKLIFQSVNSVA
ncbi:response regulator transcription factor [Aliikangiella maris]|uniref:Response regulator transcription factor n=2 Tax=Aliikangiella maris TaxID=3162458 RepID=A0ABV3MJ27_9GAMM